MRAWVVNEPGPIDDHPLELVELPIPTPGPGEIRVRVVTCGVCRTDLHLAEGDLPPRHSRVVPGHEVVGRGRPASAAARIASRKVTASVSRGWPTRAACAGSARAGARTSASRRDSRVGTSTAATPNTWSPSRTTRTRCPNPFDDVHAAPLLCAGIIGYRALRQSQCPPAGRLGIYGFGGSAHLAAQVAISEGTRVHVLTPVDRCAAARARARGCECRWGSRSPAGTARRGRAVRAGGHARAPGARGARSGWDPCRRGHLPERHPGARLRPLPLSGTNAP